MGIEKGKSQVDFGFGFVRQLIWFQGFRKNGDWNPLFWLGFLVEIRSWPLGVEIVGWVGAET